MDVRRERYIGKIIQCGWEGRRGEGRKREKAERASEGGSV